MGLRLIFWLNFWEAGDLDREWQRGRSARVPIHFQLDRFTGKVEGEHRMHGKFLAAAQGQLRQRLD